MRLRYRAQALADIDAIHRFLEEHSPAGARNVHPLSYQRTDDSDIRVHVVRRYRYKIFYNVTGETVEIIHVRHTSRRSWDAG